MTHYQVIVPEIWHQAYEVEADTPLRALQSVVRHWTGCEVVAVDDTLEYSGFDDHGYVVVKDGTGDVVLEGLAEAILDVADAFLGDPEEEPLLDKEGQ